mmetsp:Transcript_2252/g.5336  ORF Transcript_2252/g.5336 Transcript_2252/m.5336 type:complete len:158 (+) Transcript_2252:2588-3061(+)
MLEASNRKPSARRQHTYQKGNLCTRFNTARSKKTEGKKLSCISKAWVSLWDRKRKTRYRIELWNLVARGKDDKMAKGHLTRLYSRLRVKIVYVTLKSNGISSNETLSIILRIAKDSMMTAITEDEKVYFENSSSFPAFSSRTAQYGLIFTTNIKKLF